MKEKQKNRRNRFNTKEDDFILADLDVTRDDEELSPVPLDRLVDDEDAIDRLLIDADFNVEDKPGQAAGTLQADSMQALTPDFLHAADVDDIPDDADVIDRLLINTGFDANDQQDTDHTPVVDDLNLDGKDKLIIEQIEQHRQPEIKETSRMELHHAVAFDDIANDENADEEQVQTKTLMADDTNLTDQIAENFNAQNIMTSYKSIVDPETSDAAAIVKAQAEKPETVTQEPAMIAGNKPEQASANPEEAGIAALNHNSSDLETIQKHLNDCELKVKKTAFMTYVSLGIGIVAVMSTIAMGVIVSRMKIEISKLTELVSILEEDMGSLTEKNPEMKFNKNNSDIEQLNKKVNSLSRQLQDQSQSATETFKSKPSATLVKPAKINKSLGNRQTRIHGLEKKKTAEAAVKKVSAKKPAPVKKSEITRLTKNWSVNLVSYKEKTYAKNKAAKLVQKGVPVKVIAVNVNNVKLYRLKVDGFKSKLDATSYASKIKKSLNLSSVSVDQNS